MPLWIGVVTQFLIIAIVVIVGSPTDVVEKDSDWVEYMETLENLTKGGGKAAFSSPRPRS